MQSSPHLDRLRSRLRDAIHRRDTLGFDQAIADELNDTECLIAYEERRLARPATHHRITDREHPHHYSRENVEMICGSTVWAPEARP